MLKLKQVTLLMPKGYLKHLNSLFISMFFFLNSSVSMIAWGKEGVILVLIINIQNHIFILYVFSLNTEHSLKLSFIEHFVQFIFYS